MKRFITELLARIRSLPSAAVLRAEEVFNVTAALIYQSMVVFLTSGLLLGIAIFIYGSFYFAFVPLPIHKGPVHLIFEPCHEEMGKCGYLNASIILSERNPILMTGKSISECLTFYKHFYEL